MVKVVCARCKDTGRIPAREIAQSPDDWIDCPECGGKRDIEIKKKDRH